LKIFICPAREPSRSEKHENNQYCKGVDSQCTIGDASKKKGHALLELHEKNGVSIVADNGTCIDADQNGKISLSTSESIILNAGEVRLEIKNDSVTITSPTVTVNGNLEVTGEINKSEAALS